MSKIQWDVVVSNTPEILRYCKGCLKKQSFISSGLFRVNAQKNNLYVWLIHRCQKCSETWNMEIHSRVNPSTLDRNTYDGYLENNQELANKCAFDRRLLQKNRVDVSYEQLEIHILGPSIAVDALLGFTTVYLFCAFELDIRLERGGPKKLDSAISVI